MEVPLPGAYRGKFWDVGVVSDTGEVTLGISCKSIISNHAGTVPNRIDDLLGEAGNLHRRWPRAVIGYLFMMSRVDESVQQTKARNLAIARGTPESVVAYKARERSDLWFQRLGDSVNLASGRVGEDDFPEKFEVVSCSLLDFEAGPPFPVMYHPSTPDPDEFFDRLVEIHQQRFGYP
ncbi:hypothetical protein FXF50_23300 [Micromonospora sp. AP08]|uniref:hypothetical protein n=1 Tax=Micromonospora sp. AP08 TaxID=2604467 RepID=UPI0011D5F51C|nr:hypothetical protein [Micromonospora sp. AP08]TYB35614.1 hypothetical protein FXF50_23300 [Micromonospora sp. AP08]